MVQIKKKFTFDDIIDEEFDIYKFAIYYTDSFFSEPYIEDHFIVKGVTIGICTQGSGRILHNYRELEIAENQIIINLPNSVTRLIQKTDNLYGIIIYIDWDFFISSHKFNEYDLILLNRGEPFITLNTEDMELIMTLYSLIVKHKANMSKKYGISLVHSLLVSFIINIYSLFDFNSQDREEKPFSHQEKLTSLFFKILIQNYKEERQVSFYAEKLFLTPKYLSTMIKNVTGKPIQKWIAEMVTIEAKRLLKTSEKSAADISDELNFPNASFFSRFFKRHTGLTPLEYRNK